VGGHHRWGWLLVIALITWRHFRRAKLDQPIDPSPWQVSRAEPLLIESAVIRRDEEPAPLVLAEPAPVRETFYNPINFRHRKGSYHV
jgi:hypothetical protein